jgi:hypothetical protein
MPDRSDRVYFTLVFDNALFDQKAGARPQREQDRVPKPEQAALCALFTQVYDTLHALDMDCYCLMLCVDPETRQWYPDVSAPRAFLDTMHFCFGDITLREYTYDNVTDTDKYLYTRRPGADTRRDLNQTLPTYIALCAELFRARFPKHRQPEDWSAGFTSVPFTQLAFMLSCVARMQWASCKSGDKPKRTIYHRDSTTRTLPAGVAPAALLDRFLVNVAEVRTEITAPARGFATNLFDENGMTYDEKPRPALASPEILTLRALLAQLRVGCIE